MTPTYVSGGRLEMNEPLDATIVKIEEDKQLVFGWANIIKTAEGMMLLDRQDDFIDDENELEKAAYHYVLHSRDGGEMHLRKGVSTLVESVVLTEEKQKALGIPPNTVPTGWWIGFKVNDDSVWKQIKKGGYVGFSVHGTGRRERTPLDLNNYTDIGKEAPVRERISKYIKQKPNGKWCVYSESGKLLSEHNTKAEAQKRLAQIEHFKKEQPTSSDVHVDSTDWDKKRRKKRILTNAALSKFNPNHDPDTGRFSSGPGGGGGAAPKGRLKAAMQFRISGSQRAALEGMLGRSNQRDYEANADLDDMLSVEGSGGLLLTLTNTQRDALGDMLGRANQRDYEANHELNERLDNPTIIEQHGFATKPKPVYHGKAKGGRNPVGRKGDRSGMRVKKFNPNHDPDTGRFSSGPGGGGAAAPKGGGKKAKRKLTEEQIERITGTKGGVDPKTGQPREGEMDWAADYLRDAGSELLDMKMPGEKGNKQAPPKAHPDAKSGQVIVDFDRGKKPGGYSPGNSPEEQEVAAVRRRKQMAAAASKKANRAKRRKNPYPGNRNLKAWRASGMWD